jgi:hypothetical protein
MNVQQIEFKGKTIKVAYTNDTGENITVETLARPHPDLYHKSFAVKDLVEHLNKGTFDWSLFRVKFDQASREVSITLKSDGHQLVYGLTLIEPSDFDGLVEPLIKEIEDFVNGAKLAQTNIFDEAGKTGSYTGDMEIIIESSTLLPAQKALPPLSSIRLLP